MNQHSNSQRSHTPGYPEGNYSYPQAQYIKDEKPINWKKYFFLSIRNWYWFLIVLGIGLGVAFFKIRYSIPQFQAMATLIIEEEENTQDVVSQLRSVRYFRRQSDLANETAKLTAFTLINRTVDSLSQDIFWTAHGRIRKRPLYSSPRYELKILSDSVSWFKEKEWFIDYIDDESYRFYRNEYIDTILQLNTTIEIEKWRFSISQLNHAGHDTYSFIVNDLVSLSKRYKQKLAVESEEQRGTVISLRSEGSVGEREVDFLNMLSNIYILSELERKQTIAENTFEFIDDQIVVILDSLNKAENQLLTFRLSNNVINLSREGEIAFERLKGFHEQRTQLTLQGNYFAYLKKYMEDRNDPQTIIAPTLADGGDQLLIGAVNNLQQLYEERENLDISVHADNPGIASINERVRGTRLRIIEIVNGLIENNQLTQEQLNTEEKSIIDQLKTLPLSEQQLLNIKRKYDLYNQFYTFLLQKRAEAGIQKASAISNVRILDRARVDHLIPVGSDKKLILLMAILAGLLIPGGVIVLRDLVDNRIREREDITNNTDIPIIGTIGHAKSGNVLQTKIDPTSAFTESLRHIRTNLAFSLREKDQKVIMITSSISGEGKTFCTANLASIIAMNGKKVLIMGCDLRKPTLHKVFNISNEVGFTSFIMGNNTYEEVILPTSIENLFVLPAGPIPPNPAELIETKEMESLFIKVKKEFDYIIIDTPPIALVADALSLASYADLTLYLVRQYHSSKGVLEIVNSLKYEDKLAKPYLLINDIKPSKSMGMNYYYGYGKGYNYGYYKYGYSNKNENDS